MMRLFHRHDAVYVALDGLQHRGVLRWWMRYGRHYFLTGFDGTAFGPYTLRQVRQWLAGWHAWDTHDDFQRRDKAA